MTYKLFRKKPVIIEATQWFEHGDHAEVMPLPFNDYVKDRGIITTLEGDMVVTSGDWIIKGVKGEYYPCKPDIFENIYERVL